MFWLLKYEYIIFTLRNGFLNDEYRRSIPTHSGTLIRRLQRQSLVPGVLPGANLLGRERYEIVRVYGLRSRLRSGHFYDKPVSNITFHNTLVGLVYFLDGDIFYVTSNIVLAAKI